MALNPLDPLTAALQRKSQAKANLEGVNEDYSRATALRDQDLMGSYNPKLGNYGTGDLGTVLRGVESIMAGNKAKELKPQRMAARQEVANTENALPLWNAGRMVQKEATEQARYDQTALAAAAKEAKLDARYTNARESKDLIDPNDNTTGRFDVGPDGKVYKNGVEVGDRSAYVTAPTSTKTKTKAMLGGSGYGSNLDDRAVPKLEIMGKANRVAKIGNSLSPESKAKLNDSSNLLKQVMLSSFSPSKASALIKNEFSGYGQDAKDFIVAVSRLSAEERHELFGSALTQTEKESSEDFLARVEGLSLDQMLSRLGDTYLANQDSLKTYDNVGGGTSYLDMVAKSGWTQFDKSTEELSVSENLSSEIAELEAEIAAAEAAGGVPK